MAYSAALIDCPRRRSVSAALLASDPEALDITSRKLRVIFLDDFTRAAATGTLQQATHDFFRVMCRQWRGCTQQIEGLNNTLKAIIRRAPVITVPVVSARMTLRNVLTLIGAKGPECKKWSEIADVVASLLEDAVQHAHKAKEHAESEAEKDRWEPVVGAAVLQVLPAKKVSQTPSI